MAGVIKLGLSLVDGLLSLVNLPPALGHLVRRRLVYGLLPSQFGLALVSLPLPLVDGCLGLGRLGCHLVPGCQEALGGLVQLLSALVQLSSVSFEFPPGLIHLVLPLVQLFLEGAFDGGKPCRGAIGQNPVQGVLVTLQCIDIPVRVVVLNPVQVLEGQAGNHDLVGIEGTRCGYGI